MRLNVALLGALALVGSRELAGQLTPPSNGGVAAFDEALQRLAEQRRLLVVGAHPDDEDTALLTLVGKWYGADAAYLALSRGEGGQNVLGPELGTPLGLLRSRELEAARAIDGAKQFFTRAFDFGYTRSLEETEARWNPDSLLKDVVRIVRLFRPHVLVPIFSGTARDGHGQHRLSSLLAQRAFTVAGDPNVYPELAREEGLGPWTPLKLYRSTRFDSAAVTLELQTGHLDTRTGRTIHQIAMASRSQHRSQDFGVLQPIGPAQTRFALLAARVPTGADRDLFDGIPPDTSWLAAFADSLRRHVPASRLSDAVPELTKALVRARRAGIQPERLELLERALTIAAGLVFDARASASRLVPGDSVALELEIYNAGPYPVLIDGFSIRSPPMVTPCPGDARPELPRALAPGRSVAIECGLRIDAAASVVGPYFLRTPPTGALYDWNDAPPAVRGRPFEPPLASATVSVTIGGVTVPLAREVTARVRDQVMGEIREQLVVVPAIDVRLEPDRLVWSTEGPEEQTFTVTLTNNTRQRAEGTLVLDVPGWSSASPAAFQLERPGEQRSFPISLRRPAGLRRGAATVQATAHDREGHEYRHGVATIAYPHVRPVSWVRPATAEIRLGPIRAPQLHAVGYVRGASDAVPEALRQVGLPIELLDADAIERAALHRFDAVIIGSRAYETDSALVRHNDRFLAYVREGGVLVVQYQQYQFVRGEYAPYPLEIGRPHDRVTDETAAVTMLDPSHPAMVHPNRMTSEDWRGWPQERGLYFPRTWDAAYTPLLEMADPGGEPKRGSLLVARYGDGVYVYTGLSFFRALPAAVPGAYRLFLNLLALGESDGG